MMQGETRSVEEARRETELTRMGLTRTVDELRSTVNETAAEIRHRLRPDTIKAEVSGYIRNRREQWLNDVTEAARRNPMHRRRWPFAASSARTARARRRPRHSSGPSGISSPRPAFSMPCSLCMHCAKVSCRVWPRSSRSTRSATACRCRTSRNGRAATSPSSSAAASPAPTRRCCCAQRIDGASGGTLAANRCEQRQLRGVPQRGAR